MTTTTPQASSIEKLLILPQLSTAAAYGLYRYFTAPFRASKANTAFKDAAFATLRTHFGMLSVAQEQHLIEPTSVVYEKYMKSVGQQPETTTLSSGLKIHWFGGKSGSKTFLYFHGGGYVMSPSPGHLGFLYQLQKDLSTKQNINIAMLEYTLAPRAQYPTQLKEAAEALQYLLQDQKKSPKDIVIGGDSAGGNLTLALLSHILHPHPAVPTKINLSEPFIGAILISPWCTFEPGLDSVTRNASTDLIGAETSGRWSANFMGDAKRDDYNQPYFSDPSWFSGIDNVAKDILIWGGGQELGIDSIEAVAETIKKVHPRTELIVQPDGAHEDFIMSILLGYKEKEEGTKKVESWLSARL